MILYGASGHAKVVYDCLVDAGLQLKAVFDDREGQAVFHRIPVHHSYDPRLLPESRMLIAIGSNASRKEIASKVKHSFAAALVHPSALIARSAFLHDGTVVIHGAIVQSSTQVGRHCILNTGCSVDHDCELSDFVHVGPGAHLCGGVRVGEGTLIGAGAIVIPNISIGSWCTVGAGAVVTESVPDNATVIGVPARRK
jgi:acetyltransferase EpsM